MDVFVQVGRLPHFDDLAGRVRALDLDEAIVIDKSVCRIAKDTVVSQHDAGFLREIPRLGLVADPRDGLQLGAAAHFKRLVNIFGGLAVDLLDGHAVGVILVGLRRFTVFQGFAGNPRHAGRNDPGARGKPVRTTLGAVDELHAASSTTPSSSMVKVFSAALRSITVFLNSL